MSSFEMNKIFAAILVAGIVAMLGDFIAEKIIHPENLEEDAVFVEGAAVEIGAPVKQTLPEPIMHLLASAEVARGEKLSRACAACHSFDKGGPQKVGPNLWNIVGEPIAAKSGFAYSDALMLKESSWTYLDLNKFLWKPKEYAPGTKMNYIGLKKSEDRAAMIAWLRTLADSKAPLPTEAEIAEEKALLAPETAEDETGSDVAESDEELTEGGQTDLEDPQPQ